MEWLSLSILFNIYIKNIFNDTFSSSDHTAFIIM